MYKLSPTLFSFLTGQLFRSLVRQFGADQVLHFLTGYADDLTLHRTIRSVRDLSAIHRQITSLLEEVKAHKLVVNQSKCVIIAKLAGREAQNITNKHSCWVISAKGEKVKGWCLGPNKTFPAFQRVPTSKYLGVMISYGSLMASTSVLGRLDRSCTWFDSLCTIEG